MTRVLLLDDSLTILKVVRLTFASTPGMEVDVAKTEAEARAALAGTKPDVVIGYARFCQERTVDFFEEVRNSCKNIVVLAESNENTQGFVSRGFNRFLKKPFHSEELRKAVGEEPIRGQGFSGKSDEPALSLKTPMRGTAQDTSSTVRTPLRSPPPPPPPPGQARTVRPPTPAFDGGAAARLSNDGASHHSEPHVHIPQITMDVESLERSYRATLTQCSSSEATVVTSAPPAPERAELSLTFSGTQDTPNTSRAQSVSSAQEDTIQTTEENPFAGMFDGAVAKRVPQATAAQEGSYGIELGLPPTEPMELEDVVVTTTSPRPQPQPLRPVSDPSEFTNPFQGTRPDPASHKTRSAFDSLGKGGVTRAEIEATIDDVLMRSLERAVPAKIESKFDQEWDRMALDVAQRMKADVAIALRHDLTSALKGLIESEVRRELQSWMSREAVGLAKEVVREEIRRLIEE